MPVIGEKIKMNERLDLILKELRQSLQGLYEDRLERIILFGSQARGDALEGSDIDLLIVLRGPVNSSEEIRRTGDIVSRISLNHDVVVSCLFMSSDRFQFEKSPLLSNVRREGVAV